MLIRIRSSHRRPGMRGDYTAHKAFKPDDASRR